VLSFRAVKKNNVPIEAGRCDLLRAPPRCATGNVDKLCSSDAECHVGFDNLTVVGNDVIEVELFLSSWAEEFPAGVIAFQVKLDAKSLVSVDNGIALPKGWCAPVDRIDCADSSVCPPAYPNCAPFQCTCAGHNPALGAFATRSRTDYLLNGRDGIFAVDVSALDFRYFGLTFDAFGVEDQGAPAYLGSLILTVSANACGTFTIGSIQDITWTFIYDQATPRFTAAPALQPLFLTVNDCSRQLVACSPEHCTLDARIAHDPLDFQTKLNTNTVELFLTQPTADMSPADFEVTLVPSLPEDVVPAVVSVTPVVDYPNNATVVLDQPILQTRWTCIRDRESNKRCCIGSLPADADGVQDAAGLFHSRTADVFEVVDNLSGFVASPLPLERCDLDRSLQCLPADLLMIVDLLTGADAVPDPGVNGDSLESCPAMRLPP